MLEEFDDIVERAGGVAALRSADGRGMSKARLDQLFQVKARIDTLLQADTAAGDPVAEALAADFIASAARRRVVR